MEAIDAENKHIIILLWKVQNADLLDSNKKGTTIYSPHFWIRTLKDKQIQLKLSVHTTRVRGKHLILSFFLPNHSLLIPIDIEWSFLNSDGKPVYTCSQKERIPKKRDNFDLRPMPMFHDVFETRRSQFFNHKALTIRIRIWKSHGDLASNEIISGQSRLETVTQSFLWNIPQFSNLQLNQELTFPVALEVNEKSNDLLFVFCFVGVSLLEANAVLQISSLLFKRSWNLTIGVSILDNKKKNVKFYKKVPNFFTEPDGYRTVLEIQTRKELVTGERQFLTNDVLTLFCEVSVIKKSSLIRKYCFDHPNPRTLDFLILDLCNETSEQSDDPTAIWVQQRDSSIPSGKSPSKLTDAISHIPEEAFDATPITIKADESLRIFAEDILSLYRNETLTDFVLHSGSDSFRVHKNILSARSSFFREMFTSKSLDSGSDVKNIPEVATQTLNETLIFLYSGQLENLNLNFESVLKLHDAAEKYKVQSLQEACCNFIRSHINTSNMYDVLQLSDRSHNLNLKTLVKEFLFLRFDEILGSPEWKDFMVTDPRLFSKTMFGMYLKKLNQTKENSQ